MKVLLLGATGFIGSAVARALPEGVELTAGYCSSNPDLAPHHARHRIDLLSDVTSWEELVEQHDAIVVAARPNGSTGKDRLDVAQRTKASMERLCTAIRNAPGSIHVVAVHGSLSYGCQKDRLIQPGDGLHPVGFAEAYAIAEGPLRQLADDGRHVGVFRAPWVLGPGSWYLQMYASGRSVPILGRGEQWMSLVTVDDLATQIWEAVMTQRRGVIHPKLLHRCRQVDFAHTVSDITQRPLSNVGRWRLWRWEPQMRRSVMASIRLADGHDNRAESDRSRAALRKALAAIHEGLR
jgi:nucleoside-diphosphate-sugar epimerase